MTTYTYSLSVDFGGNINDSQFHREVVSLISTELTAVNRTEDVVDVVFVEALSEGDQTILDTVVADHVPETGTRKTRFYTYTPKSTKTSNTVYQRIGGPFKYSGSRNMGTINQVEVISHMDTGVTSYSVRLYNATSETILGEVTGLTNTTEDAINLGVISNIPEDEAILEIHAKMVGGSSTTYTYVDDVVIYYNNSAI